MTKDEKERKRLERLAEEARRQRISEAVKCTREIKADAAPRMRREPRDSNGSGKEINIQLRSVFKHLQEIATDYLWIELNELREVVHKVDDRMEDIEIVARATQVGGKMRRKNFCFDCEEIIEEKEEHAGHDMSRTALVLSTASKKMINGYMVINPDYGGEFPEIVVRLVKEHSRIRDERASAFSNAARTIRRLARLGDSPEFFESSPI